MVPEAGSVAGRPRIPVTTNSAVGNESVTMVRRLMKLSRRERTLLRVVRSTLIRDAEESTIPRGSSVMPPVIALVIPTASLGSSEPASCSRTMKRASLPCAASDRRIGRAGPVWAAADGASRAREAKRARVFMPGAFAKVTHGVDPLHTTAGLIPLRFRIVPGHFCAT